MSYVPNNGLFPELWTKNSLRKTAFQVFMALSNEARTYQDIMDITGRTRSSTYNALNKLSENGLAIKNDKGWIRGEPIFEELERKFNCAENSKKRKEAIERERKEFYERDNYILGIGTKHRLLNDSDQYFMDDSLPIGKQSCIECEENDKY